MPSILIGIALLSLLIWGYLLFFRGGFWRCAERLDPSAPAPSEWPAVTAIVPARDEADVIATAIASLLDQDYPGPFSVILVDDHSQDGTARIASETAAANPRPDRFKLLQATPLPAGWTGKLWALDQGLQGAAPETRYVWFSDADIAQPPAALRQLVAKAEAEQRDLVSLMVALRCEGFWERLLIPPFIYFFQKLYPFSWVNDPGRQTAAAAGGCILLRRDALTRIGGLSALSDALIDDCSLAAKVKQSRTANSRGLWLGLAEAARSIRPYAGLSTVWDMVARSAYTQLNHQPLLLLGTLLGMFITYLAPPLAVLSYPWHLQPTAALLGGGAWIAMSFSLLPVLRLYGQRLWLAPLLPLSAALYSAMTFDSAWRHWRSRGGTWKGRVQAKRRELD
ncbi:glycosyltransferase [Pelagibius litoralis]|uniref:Glycosyltransferase n=1 Tax=Pelagibius litoralis TaxID=374515 RepID=A0A967EYR8_9PROT|nr:glycosyltransferase [Pelagibius litoralis]NIA69834.1 glycosyltransferase [Pelagibius litoralis]